MKHIQNLRETLSRKKIKIIDNEQGLTLLEVLISLLILSMVLVTMLDRFALAGRQNNDTYRYNEALSLAQSKIEEIKKKDFNSVTSIAPTSFPLESDYEQFQGMAYKVTVIDSGLGLDNKTVTTKTVTVTVSYSDEGIGKQLDLTTEVARK